MEDIITEIVTKAPEGKCIDKEAYKQGRIEFIDIDQLSLLPESWEDLKEVKGEYIDSNSCILDGHANVLSLNKNIAPKGLSEPILCLIQLLQLRDRYNGKWEPDWKNSNELKYIIDYYKGQLRCDYFRGTSRTLAFKSRELRDKFYNSPKIMKLIEGAKELI